MRLNPAHAQRPYLRSGPGKHRAPSGGRLRLVLAGLLALALLNISASFVGAQSPEEELTSAPGGEATTSTSEEPAAEEPAAEEPAAEEPAAEEPAAEEPAEEPAPEEPAELPAAESVDTEEPARSAGEDGERVQPQQEAQQPSRGFIQVEGVEIDDIPQNAPHQGCIWTIEFRNFDASLGGETATATLTLIPPTTVSGQTFSVSASTTLSGVDEAGPELDAVIVLDISGIIADFIAAGGEPHPQQEIHVRLDAEVAGHITKHHVFWNLGCLPPPVPGVEITKSCPQVAAPGEEIEFEITITNTGEEDLDIISVIDTLVGDITAEFDAVIPVGGSDTALIPFTVPLDATGDLSNVVTVQAEGAVSDTAVSDTAECTVPIVPPPVSGLQVTKTCPPAADVGDTITYEITVTNTGEDAVDIVSVVDSLLGDLTAQFPDVLAVGEDATIQVQHTVTGTDPDPVVNTVTVTGVGVESGDQLSATADCVTDLLPPPDGKVPPDEPPLGKVPPIVRPVLAVTGTGILGLAAVTAGMTLSGGGALYLDRRRRRTGAHHVPPGVALGSSLMELGNLLGSDRGRLG